MSRIITGPNGVRYRIINPEWLREEGFDPDKLVVESTSTWGILLNENVVEPLPRIPSWPLAIPAPQYLSDDPDCPIAPGDIVITVWPSDWLELKYVRESMLKYGRTLSFFLPSYDDVPNGWKAFLVQRKDPEADA